MSKYRLIHAQTAYFPIVMMCRLLGISQVSPHSSDVGLCGLTRGWGL